MFLKDILYIISVRVYIYIHIIRVYVYLKQYVYIYIYVESTLKPQQIIQEYMDPVGILHFATIVHLAFPATCQNEAKPPY